MDCWQRKSFELVLLFSFVKPSGSTLGVFWDGLLLRACVCVNSIAVYSVGNHKRTCRDAVVINAMGKTNQTIPSFPLAEMI